MQPMLICQEKCGLTLHRQWRYLTVFPLRQISRTSPFNLYSPDPGHPSLCVVFAQKPQVLTVSNRRGKWLEKIISFPILEGYHSI